MLHIKWAVLFWWLRNRELCMSEYFTIRFQLIEWIVVFTIREVARHSIDHVGAAVAFWKMRCSVNSVNQPVTLQLTYSAIHAPFAKRPVSCVVGFPILAMVFNNQYWLWSHQQSRPWDVRLENGLLSCRECYICMLSWLLTTYSLYDVQFVKCLAWRLLLVVWHIQEQDDVLCQFASSTVLMFLLLKNLCCT